jgi:diguanylate cyclase
VGLEFALWTLTALSSVGAFAWAGLRRASPMRLIVAAAGLGSAMFSLLLLGVLSAGWMSGTEWRAVPPLLLAWAACVAGCAAVLAQHQVLRGRERRVVNAGRLVAAALLGIALAAGQQFVLEAAQWPELAPPGDAGPLPPWMLAVAALLASLALLAGLHALRGWCVRAEAARAVARHELAAQALNDPLTGLPNRPLFEGTLAQAVKLADALKRRMALLLINLDGFQPINQALGYRGGDQVLREVARRLRALSEPHMAARLAGDEFLMLLTSDPRPEEASALAAEILAAVAQPIMIEGRETQLSCSIGIAMYPEHGAMSALFGHAEAAMRTAKGAGGASHAFFEARMINGSRDQAELLRDLRLAQQRGQLELYYQPKIHAPSGEITGAEALMRWHHPQRGMVSPAVFIPIAERYGLIAALGQWMIEEACRQVRAWRDAGLRMRVAINLSAHQLRQADLAERIRAALRQHQINPDLITCEITETAAMEDTAVTTRVLGELAQVGVHISIDDFGTGHSSLAYLRKLPAQELKIDRSFVLDLETSEDARKVASAVINLAKALELKVVAEGVETEGQNRILRDFGCDQLQGFLFARPMSPKALALWAMDDVGPRTLNFRESLFRNPNTAQLA